MGVLAVALAAVNVFGGFLVTGACWRCSRRKDKKLRCPCCRAEGN
jgi:NAD/NADP transhydrogenase alpha subunit